MTAIPGTAVDTIELICDECATVLPTTASTIRDDEIVWPVIAEMGWNGSPFASGPHRCASCTSAPPARLANPRASARPSAGLRWHLAVPPTSSDAVLLTLHGDLRAPAINGLDATLARLDGTGHHVVLNLAGVDVMDPAGLGALVRAHQAARKRRAACCLVAPSRFIRTALHTMRLDQLFPIFDDNQAALGWLTGRPRPDSATTGLA